MGFKCGTESENRRTVNKAVAIVLSAGKGSRMHSKIQKQYLELLDKPIIAYTLDAFEASHVDEIILVVGDGEIPYVKKEIVEKYGYQKITRIVTGGKERYESVYEGLCAGKANITRQCKPIFVMDEAEEGKPAMGIEEMVPETYVLIHDGARAFISADKINFCISEVEKYKACVMGMPVKDTIKIVDEDCYAISTPDRSTMWQIQTPQCFVLSEIREAYKKMLEAGENRMTDDAMVMEKYGRRRVKMIEGGYDNIKVTTPDDLITGEVILKRRNSEKKKL